MDKELEELTKRVDLQGQQVKLLEKQRHEITERLGKESQQLYRLQQELKGKTRGN